MCNACAQGRIQPAMFGGGEISVKFDRQVSIRGSLL